MGPSDILITDFIFLFKHLGDSAYNMCFAGNTEDISKYIQNFLHRLKKVLAWKYIFMVFKYFYQDASYAGF